MRVSSSVSHCKRLSFCPAVAICICLVTVVTQGQTYRVTDVNAGIAAFSQATAINSYGHVIGVLCGQAGQLICDTFLWTKAAGTQIVIPASALPYGTFPVSINVS